MYKCTLLIFALYYQSITNIIMLQQKYITRFTMHRHKIAVTQKPFTESIIILQNLKPTMQPYDTNLEATNHWVRYNSYTK